MKKYLALIVYLLVSISHSHALVFSLGGGSWSVQDSSESLNNEKILSSFKDGKFLRFTHEGLIMPRILYVIGIGGSMANLKSQYSYTGVSTTSTVSELDSKISLVEGRLGIKVLITEWLYLGGGGLLGDMQLTYDRDDFVAKGADTANYQETENKNYAGHFAEAGIMLAGKNLGMRLGGEISSLKTQDQFETLGKQDVSLNSSKLYIEILWKN